MSDKVTDKEWELAVKRASGVADYIGTGRRVPDPIQVAMVEMMALNVRNRDLRGPTFLPHPHHLPESNELRFLMVGEVPKDNVLRSDARDWAAINKREAVRAAQGLKNAIIAIRLADVLLNDPDNPEVLYEWKLAIDAYVRATFKVDTAEAPQLEIELATWCEAACNLSNPCPPWLRDFRKGQKVEFESSTKEMLRDASKRYKDDE